MPLSSAVGEAEAVPEEPCWLCQGQSCSLQGFFQLLASEDVQEEEFAPLYKTCRFLLYSANSTDREITSLLLRALITLSNREDRVSRVLSGAHTGKPAFQPWAGSQDKGSRLQTASLTGRACSPNGNCLSCRREK